MDSALRIATRSLLLHRQFLRRRTRSPQQGQTAVGPKETMTTPRDAEAHRDWKCNGSGAKRKPGRYGTVTRALTRRLRQVVHQEQLGPHLDPQQVRAERANCMVVRHQG